MAIIFSPLIVNHVNPASFINTTKANNTLREKFKAQSNNNSNESKIKVVASFYPIYEFAKKIGGDKIEVTVLIPVGVEPHNFEPTIRQIQEAQDANVIIFNGAGLEGWIDQINAKLKVDVSNGTRLLVNNNTNKQKINYNPHIWLDPMLAQIEVKNIRDALIEADPKNAVYYTSNADSFIRNLSTLDNDIRTSLSACSKKDFIAFHNAFTYFADRYGLKQHSIKGASPEGEVLPQTLAKIISLAKQLDLHVIYSEDLVDPRSAETIAQDITNGQVLILSPIEGIDKQEQQAGIGYLDKMRDNLKNLLEGLDCKTG
jgi:zinc transport system substrate-binding protein